MVKFLDHKVAKSASDKYMQVRVDVGAVVESWRESVFAFEWLDQDGQVKPIEALKETDQVRRRDVEATFHQGGEVEKPVLGIGLQEHVEIGAGKAVLLSLAALGVEEMPVHIPRSNADDFVNFIIKG